MTRILIVDDEVDVLKSLLRLLRRAPWRSTENVGQLVIDCAASPYEALDKAACTAYALVLCDYRMPGLDGIELLIELRRLQPDTARLIMSGHADLDALIGAINAAGISRFVAKPWNDDELLTAIGEVLEQRERMLENQRLADEARLSRGEITAEELERQRLEAAEPGITHVIWGPDGSVLLDESLLAELSPPQRHD